MCFVTIREKFGKRVKTLRKQHQMTQEKLAECADITVNHLYRIEHGRSAASIDVVERLAYALCVEIKDLFEFSDLSS